MQRPQAIRLRLLALQERHVQVWTLRRFTTYSLFRQSSYDLRKVAGRAALQQLAGMDRKSQPDPVSADAAAPVHAGRQIKTGTAGSLPFPGLFSQLSACALE